MNKDPEKNLMSDETRKSIPQENPVGNSASGSSPPTKTILRPIPGYPSRRGGKWFDGRNVQTNEKVVGLYFDVSSKKWFIRDADGNTTPSNPPEVVGTDRSQEFALRIRTAMGTARERESSSLEAAVVAGEEIHCAKEWLKASDSQQSWEQWFASNITDYSRRSASDYYNCYKQANFDSNVRYKNMRECLKAYRQRVGTKKRTSFQTKEKAATTPNVTPRKDLTDQLHPPERADASQAAKPPTLPEGGWTPNILPRHLEQAAAALADEEVTEEVATNEFVTKAVAVLLQALLTEIEDGKTRDHLAKLGLEMFRHNWPDITEMLNSFRVQN